MTASAGGAAGLPRNTGNGHHGPFRPWSVLMLHPDFRRLFVGNSVSLLGSSVSVVALPLTAVVYLHASTFQVGLLGAVALTPHLILGLPAGVWIGRLPYRRVLVLADLAQAVAVGSVPVLAVLGLLRIWQLYVVLALARAGSLFGAVAAQSFTPALVSRRELPLGQQRAHAGQRGGQHDRDSARGPAVRWRPGRPPSLPTRSRSCSPRCPRHESKIPGSPPSRRPARRPARPGSTCGPASPKACAPSSATGFCGR